VIDAVARRDQTRMLVDGMTAANDLGLSDAVPGQIVVHTDARLRPISLGKQTIAFRPGCRTSCASWWRAKAVMMTMIHRAACVESGRNLWARRHEP
jgi:uridine kinase